MILLLALPLSASADDYPMYPWAVDSKNPDTIHANYELGIWNITEDGILDFSVIAVSEENSDDSFKVQVLDNQGGIIAEQIVSPTFGNELEVPISIPKEECDEGQYFIQVNNIQGTDPEVTDGFQAVELLTSCQVNDCTDSDGDTFTPDEECNEELTCDACNCYDCDDEDATINPAATEVCDDGIDNDCDDKIDCEDSDCADDPLCTVVPPVPEMPTIALLSLGFVSLAGYIVLSRRKNR
jgi:hypothetical protein